MAISDLLKTCSLFHELYDKEIEKVVKKCHVYTFHNSEPIVKDGEVGDQVFVVLDGMAVVQKQTDKGLLHIQTLQRGDVFGELVLVGNNKRSADIVAQGECVVLELPYQQVFDLYQKEPKVFGLLLLNLSRLLVRKLQATNDIIVHLQQDEKKTG